MKDRLIKLHRVTKVVKGGRIFSYTSTSISGNENGIIGFGRGKSREVIESIKKSYIKSNKNSFFINLLFKNKKIYAKHCSTKVLLIPAHKNIGIISNKYIKQIMIISGIKSLYSKIHGSTNTINVIICTIKALSYLKL